MPVDLISEQGKEIIFADFSHMKDQEKLLADAKKAANMIKERNQPNTLFLVDFTETSVGMDFMSQIKDDGKYILKNIPMITAVTGITGLKKVMIQGYIRFTGSQLRVFDSLEEAKGYLVGG